MTNDAKNLNLFPTVMIAALCVVIGVGVGHFRQHVVPPAAETGVSAYLKKCGADENPSCVGSEAIKQAFGFDVAAEIQSTHEKMKATAKRVADGKLTDDAYEACLKIDECATVPMLPEGKTDEKISKAFWQLAEGHKLSAQVCGYMPVCATALKDKVVAFGKKGAFSVKK